MAKNLRAVQADERQTAPPSLAEAVESGDVLDMLLAQRRLIAGALATAADNTRPQLNNELNKLHTLIREEQGRRAAAADATPRHGRSGRPKFDASAI